MARIRTIKPEFCVSEQLGECSTTARLLFVEMWMFCDDGGNHPARVMQLKAECFPFDAFTREDMQILVEELLQNGLLVEYTGNDGQKYWHVKGWRHQKIDRPSYKHPKFDEDSTNDRRTLDEPHPPESTVPESTGGESSLPESKGKESMVDSRVDDEANGDHVDFSIKEVRATVDRISKRLSPRTDKDRSEIMRTAILATRGEIADDWLWDSVEAVIQTKNKKPMAYFHACMKNKCAQAGKDFNQLLAKTEIPP